MIYTLTVFRAGGLICMMLALSVAWAADGIVVADGYPTIPNPIGFELRVALIDWFHENHITIAETSTDQELIARYTRYWDDVRAAQAPKALPQPEPKKPVVDPEQVERETLLLQLRIQYHVTLPDNASLNDIQLQLDQEQQQHPDHIQPATHKDAPEKTDSPKKSKKQSPVAKLDNRNEWAANAANAPTATRGNLTVTVYIKQDDAANYYVMVEANHGAVGARLLIDDVDYGTVAPGRTTMLRKMACPSGTVNQSPTIVLHGL